MLVSRGEQPLTVMCLTFLVTEKNDALTYNLGEEDKSELAHIVGELEDQRPIHSPSISLGEKTLLVSRKTKLFTPPTISVRRTREISLTS